MNLHIDATNNLKTLIRLDEKEFVKNNSRPQDQDVLGSIMDALKQSGITLGNLSSITVNPGPGSFTGSRVGVAIANSLAFALDLKVNDQEPPVLPIYSEPPRITTPKSK